MEPNPRPATRRFGRLGDDRAAAVAALAEAVQIRDGATAEHSQSVAAYCRATAVALGLGEERTAEVELAGALHDLGKIAIADSILLKAGPLTESERHAVEKHPAIGARIVRIAGLLEVSTWILLHHERPDGCGYPHGLAADSIPLEASIVAVADAYQAMTSDRVYRAALDAATAQAELQEAAGTQFDARTVEAFLALPPAAAAKPAAPGPMAGESL
jgi:HD-GYP domain-containing protein (c-di-GMP phosphodiesterase class II)